jgi:hypothetical protein
MRSLGHPVKGVSKVWVRSDLLLEDFVGGVNSVICEMRITLRR